MIGSKKRDDNNEKKKKRRKTEFDHFNFIIDSILMYDEICYPIEKSALQYYTAKPKEIRNI
jgi:hypothetical protein